MEERERLSAFSWISEAALALAGSCHSGSGMQSFLIPAAREGGSSTSSAVPATQPQCQSRRSSSFLNSGFCLFFLLLLQPPY